MSEDEHTESELIASYFIDGETFHITAARWTSSQETTGPFDLFWIMYQVDGGTDDFGGTLEPMSDELDAFPTYEDVREIVEAGREIERAES